MNKPIKLEEVNPAPGITWYSLKIPRSLVENREVAPVAKIFRKLSSTKSQLQKFQGKIILTFDGYDDDPREIFGIDEARHFVKSLNEAHSGIVHFLNLEIGSFNVWFLCLVKILTFPPSLPIGERNSTEYDKIDMALNLKNSVMDLMEFYKKKNIPQKMTDEFKESFIRNIASVFPEFLQSLDYEIESVKMDPYIPEFSDVEIDLNDLEIMRKASNGNTINMDQWRQRDELIKTSSKYGWEVQKLDLDDLCDPGYFYICEPLQTEFMTVTAFDWHHLKDHIVNPSIKLGSDEDLFEATAIFTLKVLREKLMSNKEAMKLMFNANLVNFSRTATAKKILEEEGDLKYRHVGAIVYINPHRKESKPISKGVDKRV
jgi:hypothetical protein